MPDPAVGSIRLLDGYQMGADGVYYGDFIINIPGLAPGDLPPSDSYFYDYFAVYSDGTHTSRIFVFWPDADPSHLAADQVLTGVAFAPPYTAGGTTNSVGGDSGWDAFSAGSGFVSHPLSYTFAVDPDSNPDWWRPYPAPTITDVSPASGYVNDTVVITGTNFDDDAWVVWSDGSGGFVYADTVTVDSDTQITTVIPYGAATGVIEVQARGGNVDADFTVFVPPPPTITSLTPNSGAPGDTIVITGTNLATTVHVYFAGSWIYYNDAYSPVTADFTVDSDTQITCTVPPAGAITGPVWVITAGGDVFSVPGFSVPGTFGIADFSPKLAPLGDEITVTGTGFTDVSNASWGPSTWNAPQPWAPQTFVVDSDTQLRFNLDDPYSYGYTTGRIFLLNSTATYPSFQETYSHDQLVRHVYPLPTITGFSPSSGVPGTAVTIVGTNFTAGISEVAFNGTSTPFVVVDDNTITTTVPDVTSGPITVTNSTGTATSATFYVLSDTPPPSEQSSNVRRVSLWKDRG